MTDTNVYERIEPYLTTVPVPIDRIIRQLGVEVEQAAELPDGISGEIGCKNGRYVIRANAQDHAYRQRFTLAHELGHYALHRGLIGNGLDDDKMYRSELNIGNYANAQIKRVHERQANAFAAKVLMPTELVHRKVEELSEGSEKVKLFDLYTMFQVSPSAMAWRIKNLNLADKVNLGMYA